MRAMKNASTAALLGIWMTAFVVTILYVGRQLFIVSAVESCRIEFRVAVLKDREEPVETTECKLTPLKHKIRFAETFGIELSACTNSTEA
jgi:hypothetical protein